MRYLTMTLPVFGCLLAISVAAKAQEGAPLLLTADFDNVQFEKFVSEVKMKTGYRIYYDPVQIDSLFVTANFIDESLQMVLEKILKDSGFEFTIDAKARDIFILRGQKIITELPGGFFGEEKRKEENQEEEQFVVDLFDGYGKKSWLKEDKLYEIGKKTQTIVAGTAIIKGNVKNAQTGEPVIAASVFIEEPFIGAASDPFGNFTLVIPKGRHVLKIKSVGMLDDEFQIVLYSNGEMDIELIENVVSLKEVEVRADRDVNVTQAQMGVEKMSIRTIRQVPTVMGEPDILRVVLTIPGVKTVGEASTGFNVRGGAVDQNLILFNNATVYNPSHLFGFFSAFNSDVLDGVELYKSSIPARYGGRLSSVLEVNPRYGNKKKVEGKAGIGLLTSRFSIEGPIIKDKTSFIIGGRATYSNWVLQMLKNPDYRTSKGSFYDANLNLSHEISEKSNLYFTGYYSKDKFKLRSDTLYAYDNINGTLKWKNLFSEKLIGTFSGSFSSYSYGISSELVPVNAFDLSFRINQLSGQADFTYNMHARHTFNFGLTSVRYNLRPGSYLPLKEESEVTPNVLEAEQGFESALYLADQFDVSNKLFLHLGVRYSLYNYLGPKSILSYANDVPRTEDSIIDTLSYQKGDLIKTYHGPEFRLSVRYMLSRSLSVKAGYNTLRQYIHMLSNTTVVSPTDTWKLSDPNINPQFGEQFSLGFYKNFRNGTVETSVEGYYKNIRDYLDYKAGAGLIMNPAIEAEVVNTEGKAYGAEFMVKKLSGKLNGWLSYTYSRTLLRMDDPMAGDLINFGNWYPASYDKPHDFTFIGNYKFSHRFSVSLNTTYSTGRPITLPYAKYWLAGSQRVLYSDRNSHRLPDYFRIDLSMNIEGNHYLKQLTHNFWTIGIYNLTGRRNVYSTYFVSEGGKINGYKLSIFGSMIPFVNYNIRF